MLLQKENIVIGALHLMPLIGYKGYTSYKSILEQAKLCLKAFGNGGADAVIIENNYNLPHKIKETLDVIEMMSKLTKDLNEEYLYLQV